MLNTDPKLIAATISGHRYQFADEARLQDCLEELLKRSGIEYIREYRLSGRDRVDFLAGRTAIEVKTGSSRADVLRQLHRYAASDQVDAIILVSTKARHLSMPSELQGKPVFVASLLGGSF